MAKRGRQRIHPPKMPKGEDPAVTIANQDLQIKLLTERVVELKKNSDDNYESAKQWRQKQTSTQETLSRAREEFKKLESAYTRLQGWQDCAREILQSKSTGE